MKNISAVGLLSLTLGTTTLVAQPVVVATPTTGELGSVIRLTVVPPTPGFELTPETTGIWFGTYATTAADESPFFTTTYSGPEITIIDDWTAEIVLGAGVFASKVEPISAAVAALFAPNGVLTGTYQLVVPNPCIVDFTGDGVLNFFDISIFLTAFATHDPIADLTGDGIWNFFDISLFLQLFGQGCGATSIDMNGPIAMAFTAEPAQWHHIHYPGGWGSGFIAELLYEDTDDLEIFKASLLPGLPSEEIILGASGAIYAIVLDIESNATTNSGNPGAIGVDVFTVDGSGIELDRIQGLLLEHQGIANGRTRYSSVSLINVMLTDVFMDDSQYSSVRTLIAPGAAEVFVVLSIGN